MGFLVLLKFSVKCFDILAWPLFALGYPLCVSIRANESNSNSDIRKLVTYWVLFSLIWLFDHSFAWLLAWLSFWPYVKLLAIFGLVVPHFDGSFYVYENLVRLCFPVNPRVFIEWCNNWKEKFFLNRENFLVVAERYVEENGTEGLERLIASKCKEPNVAQKKTKEVEVKEKKEVAAELKCNEPNVAQKETKEVELTEKEEVAASKWVSFPNLGQTENRTMATTVAATIGSDNKLPEMPASKKVVQECTCAPCQVMATLSETILNSHLRGKKHKANNLCWKHKGLKRARKVFSTSPEGKAWIVENWV